MRKLASRRESTDLPMPAGGSIGLHPRRPKHRSRRLLLLSVVAAMVVTIICITTYLSGSPMAALRRAHAAGRTLLTAEEEQVAEQVRAEVLRRRGQKWSRSPVPSALTARGDNVLNADATPGTTADVTQTTAAPPTGTINTARLDPPPTPAPVKPHDFFEAGQAMLEEPDRLPGLKLQLKKYSSEQLLEKFGDTDYIYSFANGSDSNHQYRKEVRLACLSHVLSAENASYIAGRSLLRTTTSTEKPVNGTGGHEGIVVPLEEVNPFQELQCSPTFLKNPSTEAKTLGDFLSIVERDARFGVDNRDRETDELRHSIRSVERHIRWHRGRVVMVSPGHHPTWVDGAKNFLAGTCGGAAVQALRTRGTHLRLTTVHQDAIMPYGMRFTADSHTIEQHIWRVKNTSAVHVYMNDDYFVNRDVAITDLFNEYGGTIVRTEGSRLTTGVRGDHTASWSRGVANTEHFNIRELDVHKEDYLPDDLVSMWQQLGRLHRASEGATARLPVALKDASLTTAVDVAHAFSPEPQEDRQLTGRRSRYYATHAPFAYCTNMFRFFETRYEREFANASLHHRGRKARDLFIPFLYNAFIMARPWQASPQFLPYLVELHRLQREGAADKSALVADIALDNFDGCAPASLAHGRPASGCMFGKFSDNLEDNKNTIRRLTAPDVLYFNINAGFKTNAAADQLRSFLSSKFPIPVYLESGVTVPLGGGLNTEEEQKKWGAANAALTATFDALMRLPVLGVVSYTEGVCPLVRSLQLAFAGHHRGRVHVSVQRLRENATDEALRETRERLNHGVVSAIPVSQCGYAAVTIIDAVAETKALTDVVTEALATLGEGVAAGVTLPSTCGGAVEGLRVRGFVVDARTPNAPVTTAAALREALAMPGQTLALEDFRAVRVGPEERDVVLVLSREDAEAKAVHWITGASENDLLLTYPLPVRAYEDMNASLKWVMP